MKYWLPLLAFVVWAAFAIATIYVALHFIVKFW